MIRIILDGDHEISHNRLIRLDNQRVIVKMNSTLKS